MSVESETLERRLVASEDAISDKVRQSTVMRMNSNHVVASEHHGQSRFLERFIKVLNGATFDATSR